MYNPEEIQAWLFKSCDLVKDGLCKECQRKGGGCSLKRIAFKLKSMTDLTFSHWGY